MTKKRKITLWMSGLSAVCVLAVWAGRTQEPSERDVAVPAEPMRPQPRPERVRTTSQTSPEWPESGFGTDFRLPDSLDIRISEWPDTWEWPDETTPDDATVRPAVPMTSVVVVQREHLPVRTMILRNNTLRLGRYVIISNGQAENWGGDPAGYRDARTISLPMP